MTFVARGLESVRGFDLFVELARRVSRVRRDVLFAVAGDERAYYGWDPLFTGDASFKQWALGRIEHDPARWLFLGHVEAGELARLRRRSTLHVYLSVPFVPSWSLFDALACGCVVLAGDTGPTREVIRPGENGLLEPLFDLDRLAETALGVLNRPAAFRPLGQAARRLMEERYSLDVTVPGLKAYFEWVASAGRRLP
jgi:glycosyltransferase involved in cell wall biosynthesis